MAAWRDVTGLASVWLTVATRSVITTWLAITWLAMTVWLAMTFWLAVPFWLVSTARLAAGLSWRLWDSSFLRGRSDRR
jgi:hypothetical protein